MFYNRKGEMLGEWPLYYFGASQYHPDEAEVYFCGVGCVNAYHKERKRHASE